jgi:hypothetical protein
MEKIRPRKAASSKPIGRDAYVCTVDDTHLGSPEWIIGIVIATVLFPSLLAVLRLGAFNLQ